MTKAYSQDFAARGAHGDVGRQLLKLRLEPVQPVRPVPNSAIFQKPFASAQLITAISHLLNEVAKGVTE